MEFSYMVVRAVRMVKLTRGGRETGDDVTELTALVAAR
jgi:hypothetical protein